MLRLLRLLFRVRQFCGRLVCKTYRWRAKWESVGHGGQLSIARSVLFNMPLVCNGKGATEIAQGCILGFPAAPRSGDGAILVQARHSKSRVSIGKATFVSNNVNIIAYDSVTVGENCLIGDQVCIMDGDGHGVLPSERKRSDGGIAAVSIENGVWLGSRAMVLKGVTIGENTIVGAGSVVVKSLPPNVIAAGVPAKVIKNIA